MTEQLISTRNSRAARPGLCRIRDLEPGNGLRDCVLAEVALTVWGVLIGAAVFRRLQRKGFRVLLRWWGRSKLHLALELPCLLLDQISVGGKNKSCQRRGRRHGISRRASAVLPAAFARAHRSRIAWWDCSGQATFRTAWPRTCSRKGLSSCFGSVPPRLQSESRFWPVASSGPSSVGSPALIFAWRCQFCRYRC